MNPLIRVMLLFALLSGSVPAAPMPETAAKSKPLVQLALLLDTSNSMDGLIDQAKSQLWKIVNEFITASVAGQRPEIQVALYHYGTPSLGAHTGYIKQLLPLTSDLDKVSEALFNLTTHGGDEYCGAVIAKAVDDLAWGKGHNDYRAIFIAGNEPFTQGRVDYRTACKRAITKGILVNTIYCGTSAEGIETRWKDGADLADGAYFSIDQNQQVAEIPTPFDQELVELGATLNTTYIGFGERGAAGRANQERQDMNAAQASPASLVQRSITKSQALYKNTGWDLVDAVDEGKIKLEEIKKEELPEEMRSLSVQERRKFIENKRTERDSIQNRIDQLRQKRGVYIAAEEKKNAAAQTGNTLDQVMSKALRTQAEKVNYTF